MNCIHCEYPLTAPNPTHTKKLKDMHEFMYFCTNCQSWLKVLIVAQGKPAKREFKKCVPAP